MGTKLMVEVILPVGRLLDAGVAEQSIRNAMRVALASAQRDFLSTVSTWSHKPSFRTEEPHSEGHAIVGSVSTRDEVYATVNAGAKPHVIRPRRARKLRFQRGYRAKTRPRTLASYAGGPYGPEVCTEVVHHPGFEPRAFSETVAERASARWLGELGAAMQELSRRSRVPSKVVRR
jgi:hypothetical protein